MTSTPFDIVFRPSRAEKKPRLARARPPDFFFGRCRRYSRGSSGTRLSQVFIRSSGRPFCPATFSCRSPSRSRMRQSNPTCSSERFARRGGGGIRRQICFHAAGASRPSLANGLSRTLRCVRHFDLAHFGILVSKL